MRLEKCEIRKVDSQSNKNVPICGQDKLIIIDWLQAILRLNDERLIKIIDKLEFPRFLLSLLDLHYMNSTIHHRIYDIFSNALISNLDSFIETVIPYDNSIVCVEK